MAAWAISKTCLLLTLLLVVTACGRAQPRVVPFVPLRPPSEARAATENDPPCARTTTEIVSRGRQPLNSAYTLHYIGVVNHGSRRCAIGSRLAITVVPQRYPIAITSSDAQLDLGGRAPERLALLPGETAGATLSVAFDCNGLRRRWHRVPIRVGVDLIRPLRTSETVCGPHASIEAGQLVAYRPAHDDERTWPLRARLVLPRSVRRGAVLRYELELTNVGRRPFRFHSCPWLVLDTGTFVLNCAAAGAIPPGSRVRFEIRERISTTARGRRVEIALPLFGGRNDFDLHGTVALRG